MTTLFTVKKFLPIVQEPSPTEHRSVIQASLVCVV